MNNTQLIQNVLLAQHRANLPISESSSVNSIDSFIGLGQSTGGEVIAHNIAELRLIRNEYYRSRSNTGSTSTAGVLNSNTGSTSTVDLNNALTDSSLIQRGIIDVWPNSFQNENRFLTVQQSDLDSTSNLNEVLVDFFTNSVPDPSTLLGAEQSVVDSSIRIVQLFQSAQHIEQVRNISAQNLLVFQSRARLLHDSYASSQSHTFIINHDATLFSGWGGLLQLFSAEGLHALNSIFNNSSLIISGLQNELFLCAWLTNFLSPILLGVVYAPHLIFNSVSTLRQQFRQALNFSINLLQRNFMFDNFRLAVINGRNSIRDRLVISTHQFNAQLINFEMSNQREIRTFFSLANWWRKLRVYGLWTAGGVATIGVLFQYRHFVGSATRALIQNFRNFSPTAEPNSFLMLFEPDLNVLNYAYWSKLINFIVFMQKNNFS